MNVEGRGRGAPKKYRPEGCDPIHIKLSKVEDIARLGRLQRAYMGKHPGVAPPSTEIIALAIEALEAKWELSELLGE